MSAVGVLVIHGMGSQTAGYSAAMWEEVSRGFPIDGPSVVREEILWSPVLQGAQIDLLDAMRDSSLDWTALREFVVHSFGDALAYHRSDAAGSTYARIHDLIADAVDRLQSQLDDGAPVVVIAHSLGAHMMSNYIWDAQHGKRSPISNLRAFITFGCNIPLFSLNFPDAVARPFTLLPHTSARWLNFFDDDDVLGWPMRPLYEKNIDQLTAEQQATVACIQDQQINVGGLTTSWNPLSHQEYWTDNDFTGPVIAYFRQLFDNL